MRAPDSVRSSVKIDFNHERVNGVWHVTSPQLPGWVCSAATKEAATQHMRESLRAYLRYADDLPPAVRRLVEGMVLG